MNDLHIEFEARARAELDQSIRSVADRLREIAAEVEAMAGRSDAGFAVAQVTRKVTRGVANLDLDLLTSQLQRLHEIQLATLRP